MLVSWWTLSNACWVQSVIFKKYFKEHKLLDKLSSSVLHKMDGGRDCNPFGRSHEL